ncbi:MULTISPECIES: PhnD/SsuA/transferrin family substrate-binding protein [Synechococcales]|uniref:PhnD/SsuA/transferrin family substrate-binding protein n=1 Tax=Synechococcus sp. CS-1324 TaxID=2847980 RepID=UPI00223A8C0B|nr:PhnD/SsuA/transferrin family substrate-binding protein [Synechococcus sp. CS-1324]
MLILFAFVLGACASSPGSGSVLCGPSGVLRVGLLAPSEGSTSTAPQFRDADLQALKSLLLQASRCDVELEPLTSVDRARTRLNERHWDLAFLPPGLTAVALGPSAGYKSVRSLASSRHSRSAILVQQSSRFRGLQDLHQARIGLLPRGSLTGFYLPLYNLHGLNLSRVSYALNHASLLSLLERGEVDAIAWDEALAVPSPVLRRLHLDEHSLPQGALVLSDSLASSDYIPFLRALDANASQMPVGLGYAAGVLPEQQAIQPLRAIVESVESWKLPLDGQPYRVYGAKVAR